MKTKRCSYCGAIEDDEPGKFCCDKREAKIEAGRQGRATQLEADDYTPTFFPSTRLGVGFFLMNMCEYNWEKQR